MGDPAFVTWAYRSAIVLVCLLMFIVGMHTVDKGFASGFICGILTFIAFGYIAGFALKHIYKQ